MSHALISELTRQIQQLKTENGSLKTKLVKVTANRDSIQRNYNLQQPKCLQLTRENMDLKTKVNRTKCQKCSRW